MLLQVLREIADVGSEEVVVKAGEFPGEEIEPEVRELGEDAALVGNGGGHDDVEGGDAIGGDDQQLVGDARGIGGELVDIADFSAADRQAGDVGLKQRAHDKPLNALGRQACRRLWLLSGRRLQAASTC